MSAHVLTTFELYRIALSATGLTCQYFDTGDPAGAALWGDANNANFLTAQAILTPTANGKILIANMTSGMFVEALPTGANGVTIAAGAGTLAFGMSTNGFEKSAEIDLAAGSAGIFEIFTPDVACTILSAYLIYSVASGSTPATISVGKSTGSSTSIVAAVSTNVSAAQFSKQSLTLASTAIAADETIYLSSNGAGDAGKVFAYIKYRLN